MGLEAVVVSLLVGGFPICYIDTPNNYRRIHELWTLSFSKITHPIFKKWTFECIHIEL